MYVTIPCHQWRAPKHRQIVPRVSPGKMESGHYTQSNNGDCRFACVFRRFVVMVETMVAGAECLPIVLSPVGCGFKPDMIPRILICQFFIARDKRERLMAGTCDRRKASKCLKRIHRVVPCIKARLETDKCRRSLDFLLSRCQIIICSTLLPAFNTEELVPRSARGGLRPS